MRTKLLFLIVSFFGVIACTSKNENVNDISNDATTVLEKNKQIAASVFEQLINKRNVSAVDELYATDMIDHSPFEGEQPGIEGFKKTVKEFIDMFPDLKVTLLDTLAQGDKIATRETWKGTHVTSKKVVTGETLHLFRIQNGKITDEWSKGWEWLEGL